MFTLKDIDEIRRKYVMRDSFQKLEARKKDKDIVQPEDLSEEEKNKIISALYISRVINSAKENKFNKKDDQQILDEIQSEFPKLALSKEPKSCSPFVLMAGRPIDIIKMGLAKPGGEENYMAEAYLQHTLAENGKKAVNIRREVEGGLEYKITYDIERLDKQNEFIKGLDPKNPIYEQEKNPTLTPEQVKNRRLFVEKAIEIYNKTEKDDWYKNRIENEDANMKRIANIINNNEPIGTVKNGPGLFYILKAAKNLNIKGEKDYLEAVLARPEVNNALLEFKSSGQAKKMRAEALENEKNGKINSNGLVEGHSLTHNEINIIEANKFIEEHPNAVQVARKKLNERTSFTVNKGDTETLRKARLIEVVAKTQGKECSRETTSSGDRILQVISKDEQNR